MPFDYASVGDLVVRLDARDPLGTGTPPSDGASLTTWADLSPGGTFDASESGGITPPVYRSSVSGRPAIQFTAPSGLLIAGSVADDYDWTMFFVAQVASGSTNGFFLQLANSDTYFGMRSSVWRQYCATIGNGPLATSSDNNWHVHSCDMAPSNGFSKWQVDGVGAAVNQATIVQEDFATAWIGRSSVAAGRELTGYISALLVYRDLTTSERREVTQALGDDFGIVTYGSGVAIDPLLPRTAVRAGSALIGVGGGAAAPTTGQLWPRGA